MGCDIHAYLDVTEAEPDPERDYSGWISTFAHNIPIGRDYHLFGLLAGVRGGKALIEPRGVPEYDQMGWRTRDAYWMHITDSPRCEWCGECRHVSPASAEKWRSPIIKVRDESYVADPDAHTPSYLYLSELEKVIAAHEGSARATTNIRAVAAMMKVLNGRKPKRTRFIFWFDN
jgi:hypothetical protein